MRIERTARCILAWTTLVAGGGAAPVPAAADWLVTHDGQRVETAGPWEIRGRLVVFRLPVGGTLASLRLSDVDLEASERATLETEQSATPAPASESEIEPVLVLTDDDVGHVDATEGRSEDGPQASSPSRVPASTPSDPAGRRAGSDGVGESSAVTVRSWRELPTPDGGGIQIFGTVENSGDRPLRGVRVEVEIRDLDDVLLTSISADLSTDRLAPGEATNFRAGFPGLVAAPKVTFRALASPSGTRAD